MSLTVSKADGVTVFTVTSNPKSKWPLFFQMLGTMCYSPVCSVSQRITQQLGSAYTALATAQIMIGLINLGVGFVRLGFYSHELQYCPFWLGGVFIAVGIVCILAERFPSACLVFMTVMMNVVGVALAITGIVLYSVDLARGPYFYGCSPPDEKGYRYSWTTPSPSRRDALDETYQKKLEDYSVCMNNKHIIQMVLRSLDIMMIVFAVLQICVTTSWCVLSMKVLCKKTRDGKDMEKEDPELYKPLMQE
ncbi:uncharacterized protein tmem176l.1 [Trichomycterus rosablanca]|uniref:uncharacterized protein tmem176l.1 n=1 Tax=Trichomycterus rosablanca TaxID=2290929 RepID=UPI002F35140C